LSRRLFFARNLPTAEIFNIRKNTQLKLL
jgi:hypothetical protein